MPSKTSILSRLGAGGVGIGIAVAAAPYPVDNVFQMGPLANKLMKSPAGKFLVRGSQIGGALVAIDFAWSNRHYPRHAYGNMQIGYDQWKQRPEMRKVDRTTKTLKASGGRSRGNTRTIVGSGGRSRGGRGATTLSQRASRSVRPGKRRQRCKSRNKSGKTCLRPRNHSGRHRFQ